MDKLIIYDLIEVRHTNIISDCPQYETYIGSFSNKADCERALYLMQDKNSHHKSIYVVRKTERILCSFQEFCDLVDNRIQE